MDAGTRSGGSVAASALSVGLGSVAFGVAVVASEAKPAIAAKLNWYNPSGPLSGKTGIGILVWLLSWAILSAAWRRGAPPLGSILATSLVFIALGFVLTFPPVFDVLAGKG